MTKIKLQPGDYVSTEGMTEEQYHAVCLAFMDAGAEGDTDNDAGFVGTKWIIWDDSDNCLWSSSLDGPWGRKRELTIKKILGQEEKKMTKITVFGQEESKKEEKKAIELCCVLNASTKTVSTTDIPDPDEFDRICLLGKSYDKHYDLIVGWYDDDDFKFIYLGHWNDGVV